MSKPKPTKRVITVRLERAALRRLRTAKGWMLTDPGEMDARDSRSNAIDYALRHLLANPPEHVRALAKAAEVAEG